MVNVWMVEMRGTVLKGNHPPLAGHRNPHPNPLLPLNVALQLLKGLGVFPHDFTPMSLHLASTSRIFESNAMTSISTHRKPLSIGKNTGVFLAASFRSSA